MDIQNKRIGVIGTGNMGESLIKGLISFAKMNPKNIYIYDIEKNKSNRTKRA